MTVTLERADIQGNILAGYGKQGFPYGRLILFHIDDVGDPDRRAANGQKFIEALRPYVTSALLWEGRPTKPGERVVPKPDVTLNIALTFSGLAALGVSTRTLRVMPDPFIDGMAKRARLLGDDFAGAGWRDKWDEIWQADAKPAHVLVSLNAQSGTRAQMDALTEKVTAAARACSVTLLDGHNQKGKKREAYQELKAVFGPDGAPLPTEHFGFADGISDPVFEGQYTFGEEELQARGNGAVDGEGKWRPLATGEFLLGYPDEAQESSGPITPIPFFRNGTFMAYRKIHENVTSWRNFITKAAADFQKISGISDPHDAMELLVAKMVGRWRDGVPLSKAPTPDEKRKFDGIYGPKRAELRELKKSEFGDPTRRRELEKELQLAYSDFSFSDDPKGGKCPLTSHVRRVNTRDGLDPRANHPLAKSEPVRKGGSILNNRRRILRRGLPYGDSGPDTMDQDEHGIVMLTLCADLFRQFEFVQQQWVNYGLDARAGSDTCPIVGNHSQGAETLDPEARKRNGPKAKFVVPADPEGDRPPFIVEGLPQLVETRGGDYFFVPSLTSLRLIAQGAVDPT